MSTPFPDDLDDATVIDVGKPARRHWLRWVIVAALAIIFSLSRLLSVYVNSLWFGSLGYASVYWYMFRLKLALFVGFALATVLILRLGFRLIERAFASKTFARRVIMLNNQPVSISPERVLRPLAWVVSLLFGLGYGLSMYGSWQKFALYFHQPQTSLSDPIFHKSLGFYLFTLPVQDLLSGWLIVLAFILLAATILYTLLSLPQTLSASVVGKTTKAKPARGGGGYAAISIALAFYLALFAWRVYLSRFPYLWGDHQTFSGVNFTEANYFLPGLFIVAIALLVGALIALVNAFTQRGLRLLLFSVVLPLAVFIVAGILIPSYVTNFIVKPNELGREMPYIEYNIAATRAAYKLDNIEMRNFDAEASTAAINLDANRATLDNIRLWDWHALQDTLRQIQEIRTYYDFPDVDVDRYKVGGQTRQMMLAAREIDSDKLPEASRNWVNQKLIYTHGYGVTMNTSNEFTSEGMPRFVLSDMPVVSSAPEIKLKRPEIYFGQKTNTDVYVLTKEKEFNFPQGEANNYTTYEGTGGIPIGGTLRRELLGWALDDFKNLSFSDRITPDSRVLMRRNIAERVRTLAPFLMYDNDPYIVVTDDGRLVWMIDAFTQTTTYPFSTHYAAANRRVNYLRNSVKVTIDAYNGNVNFYIFDSQDPLVSAYRATFPALFHDASEMPADVRAHVRYPETLIRTQGEVYSLYHTQNAKVFFQREDVWSVAREVSLSADKKQEASPLEPYFVLMQLPGEAIANEFVEILPFTPANRNNMIGWMAGRSDGDVYGSLLVYDFPKSRLVDGPLQIEARIDQNAKLSSQFTLWNQQGSHVRRGNMLVIPIGKSLLYVEPIYLQAEHSPMPELRLVVLATEERLGYGSNFNEAMTDLFGDANKPQASTNTAQTNGKPNDNAGQQQQQSTTGITSIPQSTQQLITRALEEFDEYQRLTAQGKLGEAGQKLEEHRRTLEELKRVGGKQ